MMPNTKTSQLGGQILQNDHIDQVPEFKFCLEENSIKGVKTG